MIVFHKVKWSNFLSTGNAGLEISLDSSPSTLIIGKNGEGKSQILDALCFSLFNRAFRDIGKPQLINSINQKQCLTEVEFTANGKRYRVIRGMKPNIFEIYFNDKLINQDAATRDYQKYLEETILKLNYKSFTQIVILGSASFTPFMQLPLAARREIIEDLLDIKIFSSMNVLLKDRQNKIKDDIIRNDADLKIQKNKVKTQDEYIKKLKQSQEIKENESQESIDNSNQEILKLEEQNRIYKNNINDLNEQIQDVDIISSQLETEELKLSSLYKEKRDNETKTEFYSENKICPTCKQAIQEHNGDTLVKLKLENQQIRGKIWDIETSIKTIKKRKSEIDSIQNDINKIELLINENSNNIILNQKFIKKIQEEQSKQVSNQNIDQEITKLKDMASLVISLMEEKSKLNEIKHYQDIASNLLKDSGIKTKIIRQYLPAINKLVNSYLKAMDFFVSFELDETFTETIKSRHRDDFSYASFSEGEKQRIDLALMLTFRAVAKMKNTCNTNLILMDEIFDSSMDTAGTDYLADLLNSFGNDTNVFVISHKGDQLYDKFKNVVKFEKVQNFSRIVGKI